MTRQEVRKVVLDSYNTLGELQKYLENQASGEYYQGRIYDKNLAKQIAAARAVLDLK